MAAVRSGQSETLVLRGEPGIGKTALWEYVVDHAEGCRILRVVGVQTEMELAFAGMHRHWMLRGASTRPPRGKPSQPDGCAPSTHCNQPRYERKSCPNQ